jgi:tRNA(Ile)-lysidine synthase
VRHLCQRLKTPLTIQRHDVEAFRRRHKLTLEEAARQVRHLAFAEVARQVGASAVALGHTADDQVETVLLHLIRGTGPTGLQGMRPVTELDIEGVKLTLLRPLLGLRRQATEEYCHSRHLRPREDLTNRSPRFLRNRVRRRLLPLLRRYNPAVDNAVLRLAHRMATHVDHLEQEAATVLGKVSSPGQGGLWLDVAKLAQLPPALQGHVLRAALRQAKGNLAGLEAVHIESLMELAHRKAGWEQRSLPAGLVAERAYTRLWLGMKPAPVFWPPLPPGDHRLCIPGRSIVSGAWRVTAKVGAARAADRGLSTYLDLDRTGADLWVRSWRAGDRFQPPGARGSKKLQDFFVDQKVPKPWRSRIPLLCGPQGVVWVVGHRVDERFKAAPGTARMLTVTFQAIGPQQAD